MGFWRPDIGIRPAYILGVALLAAGFLVLASSAIAFQVTGINLVRNHEASRLVLQSDGPLEFQVDLVDPQTVVIHLVGSRITASPPVVGDDPVIQSVSVEPDSGGSSLVVKTRSPGVTVLPFYDAASRQLTLELGGAPVLAKEVETPAEPAKPAPQEQTTQAGPPPQTAQPEPTAKPEPEAKPEPAAESRQAAGPRPEAKAPPIPAPAPAKPAPQTGPQPMVLGVRLGTHPDYTRLVLDADRTLTGRFESQGQEAQLQMDRALLKPDTRLPGADDRVKNVSVEQKDPLTLRLDLTGPVVSHKLFYLDEGLKLVLDLRVGPPQAPSPPPPPPPAPLPEAELKVSPEMPVLEPDQVPQVALGPQPQPPPLPPPPPPTQEAATPPETPATREAPAETAAAIQTGPGSDEAASMPEVPMLMAAKPEPGDAARVRGRMPPVPPPSPLAHPRGPVLPGDKAPAEPPPLSPEQVARGQQPPTTSAGEVIGRVREAQKEAKAQVSLPMPRPEPEPAPEAVPGSELRPAAQPGAAPAPPVVARRPPQGALLGPAGREDAEARDLYLRVKEALDNRRYNQAMVGFENFIREYPHHPLAAEALFRYADAYFYLHERNLIPNYQQVMFNYQKAIDLYPDSDQVPWALLMMGKAAMLAQEPYKAVGYFQVVIEDYPKSEYVPLAAVNRGKANLAQGKWNEALDEFRDAAENYPDSRYRKDADWGQAQALFGLGRYERAALLLRDMDRRSPRLRIEEPELLYYIGEAEFQLKRYPQAREYFLWALNVMPDIPDNDIILTRVGDTYQFEGAYAAAKDIYGQVVKLFPDTDGALVSRIRLAESPARDTEHPWDIFQIQPTKNAYQTYKSIISQFPDREVAQLATLKLGVYYYKKKNYEKSLETIESLLTTHPRSSFKAEAEYTMSLAAVGVLGRLKARNKPMELLSFYLRNRAIILRPNATEVVMHLAWAYENTGLHRRAANLYRVLVERGLNDPLLNLSLARNLMASSDYQGVVSALPDKVVASLKGQVWINQANSFLGRSWARLGQDQKAVAILSKLLAEQPDEPYAAEDSSALGRVYAKLGDVPKALASLDKADELFKEREGVRARLTRYLVTMEAGSLARDAGMSQEALAYYEKAAELATSGQDKGEALYEVSGLFRKLGRAKEMEETYNRLVKMQVNPWSEMASRHLYDMELAPVLINVGQSQ